MHMVAVDLAFNTLGVAVGLTAALKMRLSMPGLGEAAPDPMQPQGLSRQTLWSADDGWIIEYAV